jgi:PAS domain S-box-containing protein
VTDIAWTGFQRSRLHRNSAAMFDKTSDISQLSRDCRLFHHLPGVYYTLKYNNVHWEVTGVTPQAESLFGYTRDEIFTMATTFLQTIILPEDFQMLIDSKKAAFQVEKLFNLEFRIRTKSGEVKFVRDQYMVYPEGDHWIMEGYISETFKTTIRDRLLQQLRSYREAVDVNMISSITDRKGKIVYANENFCRISKYQIWELIGQNHRIISSGHHAPAFFQNLWKTISAGRPWHGEILNKAKDGTLYWVDTVIIPIFNEAKSIVNYLSLRIPINERKEAEAERKRYVHLLEQIAFIVAHNIRGPLCSILGLCDMLGNQENSPEEMAKIINYLLDSSKQLDSITHELSTFVYDHEIEIKLKEYKEGE